MKATKTKILTISLSEELYLALENAALEQDRSKNYIVGKAIQYFLEDFYNLKKTEKILSKNPTKKSSTKTKKNRTTK